jgi:hypothetical protein
VLFRSVPAGRLPPGSACRVPPGRIAPRGRLPPGARPPTDGNIQQNQETVRKGPNPRLQSLAKDSILDISVELLSSKSLKNQVLALFHIKNLTDQNIEKAQFEFENTSNFQVAPHPSRQQTDPIPLSKVIPPHSSFVFKLPFHYESFLEPQTLRGSFDYSLGKIELNLSFPCSTSIVPEIIDPTNFVNVIRQEASETRTCDSINTTIEKATAKLGGSLRLKIVEKEETKVSLYGKTPAGDHVCVLVKKNDGEDIAIALKSNNSSLVDSLLKEVQVFEW